jgi:anti-sigma factor RsiW
MTDNAAPRMLTQLYRAGHSHGVGVEMQALLSALDGEGSREQRDEILSAALANPAQAALLRTLTGLRSDVDDLQREVRALRRPVLRRSRPAWAAVAASAALAAVFGFGLRGGMEPQAPSAGVASVPAQSTPSDELISSVSFEGPAVAENDAAPLFNGSFDS